MDAYIKTSAHAQYFILTHNRRLGDKWGLRVMKTHHLIATAGRSKEARQGRDRHTDIQTRTDNMGESEVRHGQHPRLRTFFPTCPREWTPEWLIMPCVLQVIEKLKGVPQLLAASKRANRAAGIQAALEVVNKEGEHVSVCFFVYVCREQVFHVLIYL